jgi:putative Mg2+ transporter-C (MgtC) family protein
MHPIFFDPHFFGSYALSILAKLILSALAGGAIGFEREKAGRPAGLRTHLLVAVGACLMMIVSEAFFLNGGLGETSSVRVDPARTAAQIVTGIGFLGAGVILKEGITIRGLTTAASLWLVAGLGMTFGIGLFFPGLLATVIALFGLVILKKLEPVMKKDRYLYLKVVAQDREGLFEELEKVLSDRRLRISDLESTLDIEKEEVRYNFVVTQQKARIGRDLVRVISRLEGIRQISFK